MPPPPARFFSLRGHSFLPDRLGADSKVLDLGANRGEFTRALEDRFGCRPVLVEANPVLAAQLALDFGSRVRHCAVAGTGGTVVFHIARNDEGSSLLTLPEKSLWNCLQAGTVTVEARTLESIAREAGFTTTDLVKLDIEGAETSVLEETADEILRSIGQLTVEFHCHPSFGFGGADAVRRVIRRLRRLGFAVYVFDSQLTDVLFVNRAVHPRRLLAEARLRISAWGVRWLLACRRQRLLKPLRHLVVRVWMMLPGAGRKWVGDLLRRIGLRRSF